LIFKNINIYIDEIELNKTMELSNANLTGSQCGAKKTGLVQKSKFLED